MEGIAGKRNEVIYFMIFSARLDAVTYHLHLRAARFQVQQESFGKSLHVWHLAVCLEEPFAEVCGVGTGKLDAIRPRLGSNGGERSHRGTLPFSAKMD